MPRIFGMVLRWILLPFLVIIASAMASEFWRALRLQGLSVNSLWHPLSLFFGLGFGFRILFQAGMKRLGKDDPLEFIDTLEHELTHALMGYLTFCPPTALSATLKSGGEVQLRGTNPLAALAPYFLPLWCGLCLILGLFIKPGLQASWSRLIFFLLGWFFFRLAKEYRWRQTDLHVYGFFFSTLLVFIVLLLVLGSILSLHNLLNWQWLNAAYTNAWQTFPSLWNWALLPG
jgi:hypothetical protein